MELTDQNLSETIKSNKKILIDFWAPWCGPCRMFEPILKKIAEANSDVVICKCNVDDNPQSTSKYGITSIPTIIVINEGKVVEQFVGLQPEKRLQECLNSI